MFIIPQEDANQEEFLLLNVLNHWFPPIILIQIITKRVKVHSIVLPQGDVNHKE